MPRRGSSVGRRGGGSGFRSGGGGARIAGRRGFSGFRSGFRSGRSRVVGRRGFGGAAVRPGFGGAVRRGYRPWRRNMTRRFARGRRFPYARRRRLAYRYPYRRYYWPTSSYGYAYYPYYYDYGYYYNPYFYDYYGYYSPYYGYVYYAPAYASGVEAVPSVANDADQQPTVQAPTAMGAVNEVRISTDPSIDAQQWATQPNKAVHQGSPDAPPAFLFCTSGKPTLVEQRAATNQRPVLAIDDSFYQCIS